MSLVVKLILNHVFGESYLFSGARHTNTLSIAVKECISNLK